MTAARVLPMGHLYDTAMEALDKRQNALDARFDIAAHWLKRIRTHQDASGSPEQVDHAYMHDIRAHATVAVGGASDTVSIAIQSFIVDLRNRVELTVKKLD
jgi:hypothetical protein